MMMDQATGRVWIVKIPRFLMERWAAINQEEVHLATIRVYNESSRIKLFLPPNPANPDEPEEYELDMVHETVYNQLVVAEKEKEPGSRARTTILAGKVKHECNLRPVFTEKYRRRMRERVRKANTPQRQIKLIDEVTPGGRGDINMLSSGVSNTTGFSDLIKSKPKPAKGQFERMARIPKNQLLDLLFKLFQEKEIWSIKVLREKTQQPEAYLKEVLSEIAFLHRSGDYNGLWELRENFREDGIKPDGEAGPSSFTGSPDTTGTFPQGDVKMEDVDDDEDDDDDMEEVS